MEKTLLAVSVARQARKRKNIKFESEIRTAVYTEGTLAENEVTNIIGKLAAPTSFQVDFTTEEEQTSIYSHLGESYYVVNGDVEKLDGDENEELLNSLNLDQITKNNFERLMIYAEEMNFTTNGNLSTFQLFNFSTFQLLNFSSSFACGESFSETASVQRFFPKTTSMPVLK